jgi:cobalt-zinc-cadmium efflux system outer membrane protein
LRWFTPAAACILALTPRAPAQTRTVFTWQQLKERFEMTNPELLAGRLNVDESRTQEITAYLRPNPELTLTTDGTQIAKHDGIWQPFAGTFVSPAVSYLHERDHKRELRLESARKNTAITESQQADLERNLLFNLRNAFVQTLEAGAVLNLSRENLAYYDKVLDVSRMRLKAGDIAKMDMARLELQRVNYESDVQTAMTNLRTAKIQLLQLMNERMPVDQFDINGRFGFDELAPLEEFRNIAIASRPDLQAALQSVDKAKTDYQLAVSNGSTDPTFNVWWTHNGSFNNPGAYNTVGASVSIPLRIFDRNQGEKERTAIDIHRNERLAQSARAQVFSDVDSAYATLEGNLNLLRTYRDHYLKQAADVREMMAFAYQHGGASLLDFLSAQNDYRATQLSYLNLIGAYMTAGNQLNFAIGREVLQ